ncbi:MAG: DUF1887 family CARF protein [Potamolinea sp.]
MNIPDQYKVNHLFVLVGENPLPNYIAARTLLHNGGTVYLVFTQNTIFQKDRLHGEDGLHKLNIKCQPVDLSDNESNAQEIYDTIKKRVNESATEGKVGLNYTGGTKAMAVHAYRAIQELKPDAIFSYLDPRRLKMWINQGNQKPVKYDVPLQVSLEELFNLHGKYWLTQHHPRIKPYLPDLAEAIAELYKQETSEEVWKKVVSELKEGRKSLELPLDIEEVLNRYVNLSDNPPTLTQQCLEKEKGIESWEKFKNLFTGEGFWLESYVLNTIKKISEDINLESGDDSRMSFNVVDDKSKIDINNYRSAKFELDIAFIKGYQLFAISCTVSPKDEVCKKKLFEAYLRAKELGGDEARVALVCCSANPNKIEEDMARFGTRDPKVKVFGRSHLANLADEIVAWVDDIEQEAKV